MYKMKIWDEFWCLHVGTEAFSAISRSGEGFSPKRELQNPLPFELSLRREFCLSERACLAQASESRSGEIGWEAPFPPSSPRASEVMLSVERGGSRSGEMSSLKRALA